MKKLFIFALIALSALASHAKSYVVFADHELGSDEEQIAHGEYVPWLNLESTLSSDGTMLNLKGFAKDGTWWGGGYIAKDFDQRVLQDEAMSLKFDVKADTAQTCTWWVKFVIGGYGSEHQFDVVADGQWHTVKMNLKTTDAQFYNLLATDPESISEFYAISFVGHFNGSAASEISVKNIRYETSEWEAGKVWHGYDSEHTSYICNGKEYPYTFLYSITTNEDQTLTFNANYTGDYESNGFGNGRNVVLNGIYNKMTKQDDGSWSYTTVDKYVADASIPMFFYTEYSGGAIRTDVTYIACSENAPIFISGSVDNITENSAQINYSYILPAALEGATVKVLLNDTEITENPYTITGLTKATEYSYTLKAVATLNGEEYESNVATLTFKTEDPDAVAAVWHGIVGGSITNAYFSGETASEARELFVNVETVVTYNTDKTVTVDAKFVLDNDKNLLDIVGMVAPQVTVVGNVGTYVGCETKDMELVEENHYRYTTTGIEFPEDKELNYLYFYIRYAGGPSSVYVKQSDNGNKNYYTGITNESASYGAPASIEVSLSSTTIPVNGSATISNPIVKDSYGRYLFGAEVTYDVEGNGFSITGSEISATEAGLGKLKATCGDLTKEFKLVCAGDAGTVTLTSLEGVTYETDEYVVSGYGVEKCLDRSNNTWLEWKCSETEHHYLIIDFGASHDVQYINLVWEGASAKAYTIRLSNTKPSLSSSASSPRRSESADYEGFDYVITVTDGPGGGGVTTVCDYVLKSGGARYLTLETTEAYEKSWNIKLFQLNVEGQSTVSGIESIAVDSAADDADAATYTLDGRLVKDTNLAPGIYIRNHRKFIVR